jgi:multidrug resistance efflux pump
MTHGRLALAPLLLLPLPAVILAFACADAGARGSAPAGGALAVHRGTFQPRVLLTGELEAEHRTDLSVPRTREFQLQIRWLAEDGAAVKAGDPVVQFDNSRFSSEIEEKRLAAADALSDLDLKRAEGRTANAEQTFDVEKARSELDKARLEAAIPPDLLSQREYQDRQLAVRRAEVALAKAQTEQRTHERTGYADVAVQKITLDKSRREIETAETAIEALSLRAPRDGLVLIGEHPWEGRRLQLGDTVWPGMAVASLPDLASMRVRADLSDVDDGKVKPGMRVVCVLDAFPDRAYPGRVVDISPVARESRRSPLLRSFPVTIALDKADPEHMRPGMSVRVEVAGAAQPHALLVPRAALDLGATPPRARRADGRWQAVRLGPCSAAECVVEGGIAEGTALRPAAGSPGDAEGEG